MDQTIHTEAAAHSMSDIDRIVGFWRDAGEKDQWFRKDESFDVIFRERFLHLHHAAARRELDGWAETPEGLLALLILLDQFPRNAFRGSAHMFATDPLARHFARLALERDAPGQVDESLRLFFCLPFTHSEDLADQHLSVSLYERYAPSQIQHAHVHRDIIERFGRFPHRNPPLGRDTTPQEQAFLDAGGFAG
ncbi:MAG: DUF924 family protein [Hydrogenophaga sp.]|jgi:uncharacterized protein (DUF924 family)|uniref:DUF924 family protein n=1 Tax=Hydrogenophaga sp. TaxID=1904254 RepID=UPI0026028F28|nr:DUF924 family protein [Hydrogenophaga sp.]MDD3784614.1 DUF924 family protein [Hydrogenophaga sp.]MDX9968607.1 DUF924 family protein [Hydrogenophaga sp.]